MRSEPEEAKRTGRGRRFRRVRSPPGQPRLPQRTGRRVEDSVKPPEPKRDADDPLLVYRVRFPILSCTNYLISNSLGAVPAEVSQSLQEYYERWAMRGVAPGQKAGG